MASETVDPIDWSHPPPYTEQYRLSSTYCTLQCGLQITRLVALSQPWMCDFRMPDQRTAGAATQGIKNQDIADHLSINNNWYYFHCYYIISRIIIIIKTSDTGPTEKNKIVYKLLSCIKVVFTWENWKKHNTGKQLMIDYSFKLVQHSSVKHSERNVIPHTDLCWQETPCKLGCLCLDTSNSNEWAVTAAWLCQTLVEADGSSLNK